MEAGFKEYDPDQDMVFLQRVQDPFSGNPAKHLAELVQSSQHMLKHAEHYFSQSVLSQLQSTMQRVHKSRIDLQEKQEKIQQLKQQLFSSSLQQ